LRDHADRSRLLTYRKIVAALLQTKPEPVPGSFGRDEPGSDYIFLPGK
jgi:hypothetical protein